MVFRDRLHAGRALAEALQRFEGRRDLVVLGLPRGGVPVAYEVARQLHARLDVLVVRKLGVPAHEELAMGALASGGSLVLNREVVRALGLSRDVIQSAIAREEVELVRRERLYRGGKPALAVTGKTVILVDDGVATGATMRAAITGLRQRGPRAVVMAVPVASPDACASFSEEADEVICAVTLEPFHAVSVWYEDFSQISDEEVRHLLGAAAEEAQAELDPPGAYI